MENYVIMYDITTQNRRGVPYDNMIYAELVKIYDNAAVFLLQLHATLRVDRMTVHLEVIIKR